MLLGRIGEDRRPLVAGRHDIVAQALGAAEWMRHRLDASGIDRLHALDHAEDVVQLVEDPLCFRIRDLDTREIGDTADLRKIESHWRWKRSTQKCGVVCRCVSLSKQAFAADLKRD